VPMRSKSRLELGALALLAQRAANMKSKMQSLRQGSCGGSDRSNAAMFWTERSVRPMGVAL
jgi:hypothetical protein